MTMRLPLECPPIHARVGARAVNGDPLLAPLCEPGRADGVTWDRLWFRDSTCEACARIVAILVVARDTIDLDIFVDTP